MLLAHFTTTEGNFTISLFDAEAPNTVANFVELAEGTKEWTDPKSGQAHPYHFEAVLEVSGGPTRSPYDPAFNPHSITRIEAIGDAIQKTLNRLASTNTRFVVK